MAANVKRIQNGPLVGGVKARVVHARLSVAEYAAVEHAAATAGITVSSFIRSLMLEGAGVLPFFTEDDRAILDMLLLDMRAIGANLDRLARSANSAGRMEPGEVLSALRDVQKVAASIMIELRTHGARAARRRGLA
ncbi:plasmid mobilization protein [Rhizobium sp. A22-96]